MAVYQLITEKAYNGLEYWVNDYYIQAPSLSAAADIGEDIAEQEVELYFQPTVLTKIRVSTLPVDTGQFITRTLNLVPSTGPNAGLLPLFNVLRVDMECASGRPGRKYYRTVLTSGDISNAGRITPSHFANWQPILNQIFLIGSLVKRDGTAVTHMTIFPNVGMRQLRRGTKRKLTPII